MRVLHYPPQTGPVNDHAVGIGAHTEYVSTITCRIYPYMCVRQLGGLSQRLRLVTWVNYVAK